MTSFTTRNQISVQAGPDAAASAEARDQNPQRDACANCNCANCNCANCNCASCECASCGCTSCRCN